MLNVCLAPGIDPGRIRLVRNQITPDGYPEVVDSLSPLQALLLAEKLVATTSHVLSTWARQADVDGAP